MRTLPFEKLPVPTVPSTVLLDVDGTLVPDRTEDLADEVEAAVERWKQSHRVLLCSNAPDRERIARLAEQLGCGVANSRFSKPNPRILEEIAGPVSPMVVVGDHILTDGLFAWRVGASYLRTTPRRSPNDRPGVRVAYLVDDIASAILTPVLRWPKV